MQDKHLLTLSRLALAYKNAAIAHEAAVAEEARVCAELGPDDPDVAGPTPQSLARYHHNTTAHAMGVFERALLFAARHLH